MSSRADLVIRDSDGWRLYYARDLGDKLDRQLFWGPGVAETLIRSCESAAVWLDHVWCEGAALLDKVNLELLLFGGNETEFDIVARQVWLHAAQVPWNGWRLRWAPYGLDDIVDALEISRAMVGGGYTARAIADVWSPTNDPDQARTILSLRDRSGGTGAVAARHWIDDVMMIGPPLLDLVRLDATRMSLHRLTDGGVHLDEASRRVYVWWSGRRVWREVEERFAEAWSGWTVVPLEDHFEKYMQLASKALAFDRLNIDEVTGRLIVRLGMASRLADPEIDTTMLLRSAAENVYQMWHRGE